MVSRALESASWYLREAASCGSTEAVFILADCYRYGVGVEENKRKALVAYKRSEACGFWFANNRLGEMYRNGEGVVVNMKKAVHHYEICAKYESAGHWNLALIYKNEEGYLNKNRALYHFRFAADLGYPFARDVVGEYFVSVSVPRELSFTNDELQVFLRKMKAQFSRGNINTSSILAPQGWPADTLDCTLPELGNSQVVPPPTSQPAIAEDTAPVRDGSLFELLTQKYPYWWVVPLCLAVSLFFLGVLASYVYLLYR